MTEMSMRNMTNLLPGLLSYLLAAILSVSMSVAQAQSDDSAENPRVLMKTTDGDITIELFADKSPITVENFLRYADDAPPPPRPSGGASLRPSKKEDALRLLEQVVPRTARRSSIRRAFIDSQATGRRPAPRVLREVRRGAQLRGRRRR